MAPSPLPTWTPPTPTRLQRFRQNPSCFIAQWLYSPRPRPSPTSTPVHDAADPQALTVVCVSDTHNTRPAVPDGHLLLHAGDLTNGGSFQELQDQLDWLSSLPHPHKVVIAGNHDRLLDADFIARFPDKICETKGASRADLNWHDLHYLCHASKTLRFANGRSLRIFGSPQMPLCGTFAFQYPPIRDVWAGAVPPDTDILLTHGPPRAYLDMNGKGCPHLLREIAKKRPPLVVFGHIHAGHGIQEVAYHGLEGGYQRVMADEGNWAVVLAMFFWLLVSWSSTLVPEALLPSRKPRGRMVNAAIGGATDQRQYPATVVQI
ncbi:hypothetical protein E4U42_007184 [Claviceps africana]|uniref:Calcineurin-like phosphoesterase domain-containing protein n=1 Tax=Claviceps africana TaxID=83212 RepID=A0A8K0NIR1_9HYPO|nr:hypothetical protein E4U42_007184 [Claviceps africana]